MVNPYRYTTPDAKLRHIKFARDREEERKGRLDEMDAQRKMQIDQQMQRETQRSAELDQRDSIGQQMQVERQRKADLDEREAAQPRGLGMRGRYQEGMPLGPAEPAPLPRRVYPGGEQGPELTPEFAELEALAGGAAFGPGGGTEALEPFREAYTRETDVGPERLEQINRQRAADGLPPLTEQDLLERGWRRGMAALTAPTPGPLEFAAGMAGMPFKLPLAAMDVSHEKVGVPVAEALVPGEHPWIEKPLSYVTDPATIALLGLPAFRGIRAGAKGVQALRAGTGAAVTKPMTQADIAATATGRAADIAGTAAPDIAAGARGTPGEIWPLVERAGGRVAPFVSAEGTRADIIAGGTVAKLVDVLKTAKPLRGEAEITKAESLRRKAAAMTEIYQKYSGEEAFKRARAAERGADIGPQAFESARERFTQVELDSLMDVIRLHPDYARLTYTRNNAQAALLDTLAGKVPTRGEIALLEKFFGPEITNVLRKRIPLGKRAWEMTVDALNLPRTVLAAFDVSFPLRQGVMVGARHPKEWAGNLPELFRAGISPKRAQLLDDALRSDATIIKTGTERGEATVAELAEEGGLFRASLDGIGLSEREEFFLSNLAKKLPIVGVGVRFSERSFISYGNKLRQDIFRNTLLSWQNSGKQITSKDASALANLINRMTGRGTLQAMLPSGAEANLNPLAPLLSAGFFAPRFAISRPQAYLQLLNFKNPRIQRLAAEEIVSFVGMGVSVLSAMKLAGFDVELDPRSTDFGKIKVGKTRFDFWGGNIQWARLVAQLGTGKRKGADGVVVDTEKLAGLGRFTRYKFSPPAALMMDWFLGETPIGEQFPPGTSREAMEQAFQRLTPLAVQDLVEAVREYGMSGFMAMPAFGGVGVQTYETLPEMFERKTGQKWTETPSDYRRELIAGDEELSRYVQVREEGPGVRIREERSQTLLPLAEAVLAGTPGAARNYHENRPTIMARFSGASGEAYRDFDVPLVGDDNKILDEYYGVDFLGDWNQDGIPGDDEDVRMALEHQDGLKSQLSTAVQKALDNPEVDFPDKDVVAVEKRRNLAVDRVRELIESIPKYQGVTVEYCKKVDDYVRYVRQKWEDAKREHGDKLGWSQSDAAIELGRQDGEQSLGEDAALVISQDATWDPKYNEFLVDNQEALAPFFPGLYQRTFFREKGVLTDEIWAEVNLPIPSPTERQGMQQEAGMERFREVEQAQQPLAR